MRGCWGVGYWYNVWETPVRFPALQKEKHLFFSFSFFGSCNSAGGSLCEAEQNTQRAETLTNSSEKTGNPHLHLKEREGGNCFLHAAMQEGTLLSKPGGSWRDLWPTLSLSWWGGDSRLETQRKCLKDELYFFSLGPFLFLASRWF